VVKAESQYLIDAQGFPPTRGRIMHTLAISLNSVLDITNPKLLGELGVTPEALQSTDHTACQMVGGAVERLGHDGLLVPSARGAANNLVIYVNNLPYDTPITVLASEPF